ncbi:hypothetical protein AURDEDRAFT_173584 [Auricularia subglabra TFB-10046 SS5]|nr:hypothetical protein AURDEDRAFT_173584 [Auricularia subglabra TFB-10046 SS5]
MPAATPNSGLQAVPHDQDHNRLLSTVGLHVNHFAVRIALGAAIEAGDDRYWLFE